MVQMDNRRLRKEVARLKGQPLQSPWSFKTSPHPGMVFLWASPLCFVDGHRTRLLPLLDVETEADLVQSALGVSHLVEAEVASAQSLCRSVRRKCVWLHISAHNVEVAPGQWRLMLEDPGIRPSATKFSAGELQELLLANGGTASVSFVFLAMCNSVVYREAFKKAGFRNILACESDVNDKRAAEFARDLYAALSDGQYLKSAFSMACTCAKARGDRAVYHLDGDGLVQLPRPAAWAPAPSMTCMTLERELSNVSTAAAQQVVPLPRGAEDFVGRVPQMCEVFMALEYRLVVVLHSVKPNGRTATLRQIGQYANRRGRHFAGKCTFHPVQPKDGGLFIVDDADEVLASGNRELLLRHLHAHRGARLLLSCREPCYDTFLDCGIKPYNVPLPPLQDQEATELFLRSTYRPLTAGDLDPCRAASAGATGASDASLRIIPKSEAQQSLKDQIGALGGEPGKVRKAGVSVRPGSPPLDLPRLLH